MLLSEVTLAQIVIFSQNCKMFCKAKTQGWTFFSLGKNRASFPFVKHFRKFSSSWKQKVGFRGNTGLNECFLFVRKQPFRRSTGSKVPDDFTKWAKNMKNCIAFWGKLKMRSTKQKGGYSKRKNEHLFIGFQKSCVLSLNVSLRP